ncbi:MAG: aldo/keto reductase [Cyanobacteriota/Melainabacteria group bacterium]
MALNNYVTLGHSGLRVSPLSLGTMTFGEDWGWGSTVEDSYKIIARYLELGGNFLDTANFYTKGHSEKIIGDFIKKNAPGPTGYCHQNSSATCTQVTPTVVAPAANRCTPRSTSRLSGSRPRPVDLYWITAGTATPIEETMSALDDLVKSEKSDTSGFSDTPAWKCAQAQTT